MVPVAERDESTMRVLLALRSLSDAMDRMYGAVEDDMVMNTSDLRALRLLIESEQRGETVSPHEIASHLRITSASTTKLLDRLEGAGHLERHPHPRDRRARVVQLTDQSRRAFFTHFGAHLGTMRSVTDEFSPEELTIVADFMTGMAGALDPRRVPAPSA